ncbi:MAG TPA: bifunctional DNA primase/polymerase [Terriglobia bacterium]|nr:bifunctional DNA primase/polymerase [Terriglobia bacterium]
MTEPGALSPLGQAALAYARKGWPVFPCEPRGKKPLCEHGLKDSTTEEEVIRAWWTRWAEANIGHPTGDGVVLDIDGAEGEQALAALEAKHGKLPLTLVSKTGKGRHLYFTPNGTPIRNSTGKLGPHLDIRGAGGYVILPPSVHASGSVYQWVNKAKRATLPGWIAALLSEPTQPQQSTPAAGKIPPGQRHAHLIKIAGSLRTKDVSEQAVLAACLAENSARCEPPKPENEVRALVADIFRRYEPGTPAKAEMLNPWTSVEGLATFLENGDDEAQFLDPEKRVLARAGVTEIFAPRGLGKSLYALWLAVNVATSGLRVLYIDRDNPRQVVRTRLRGFGATGELQNLQIITREKCPPLTNAGAWALFPYSDYDVVMLDSFDSAAEGIGEQDSAKPSRAIAPVLDLARRENGPAVLILGNTIKSAAHSRGSGVVEDRADIVFEVRDATGFHFTGSKSSWIEELPAGGAEAWAGRATRRKRREKFRLAFVASKFRLGTEPEPFALEIDLTTEPWEVRDATDDVDREGAAERNQRMRDRAETMTQAADALAAEILRRAAASEPPMLKDRDAIPFLMKRLKLTRNLAREVINNPFGRWGMAAIKGEKGHPIGLFPPRIKREDGGNTPSLEPAKTLGETEADFRRVHEQGAAEIAPDNSPEKSGLHHFRISAANTTFLPGDSEKEAVRARVLEGKF